MKIHNKSHVCPKCGHAFAQLSFLNKHIQKHQEENDKGGDIFKDDDVNESAFKCEVEGCLFRSKYRNVLKRHIDAQHQNHAELSCQQLIGVTVSCNDSKGNSDVMAKFQVKCPTCGKSFDERIELRNHMFDKHDQVLQVETEKEDCGMEVNEG